MRRVAASNIVMKPVTTVVLVAILAGPVLASAQERPSTSTPRLAAPAESVDASKLGVSLSRIRRELRQADEKEQTGDSPLKLQFTVEVFGTAPRIDLLDNFPLTGPVPYGGPTHGEVLDFLTPKEFRSPVFPISALTYWAAQQLWNRNKKQQCEQELAEYKQLVMQGVAVAAPRCTQ